MDILKNIQDMELSYASNLSNCETKLRISDHNALFKIST